MAGALMRGVLRASRRLLRPVDAGRGIALERDGRGLAPRKSLLGGSDLGGDAALLVRIPAAGQYQPRSRCNKEKDLRHGSESKARPKRARLDRRDEIGGKPAGQDAEIERAGFGEYTAFAA